MLLETLLALSLTQIPAPQTSVPANAPRVLLAQKAGPARVQPGSPAAAPTPAPPKKPDAATAGKASEKTSEKALEKADAKPKPAMTAEVKALVDRMQAFYEKTQDFRSEFTQEYRYARMKRVQNSSGTVTYLKPGLMRWEYEKPAKKTFVLAGDKVYAYDPAAMQLTRGRIDTSQLSASVTFLFGQGNLADEFAITKASCKGCKGTLLELNPLEKDPRFKKIFLEVDPTTSQVLRSTVVDPDGSENTIRFVDLKSNVGIQKDSFKLDPAPGTEIIDLTQMGMAKP